MIEEFKKKMLALKEGKKSLEELNIKIGEKQKVFDVENENLINEIQANKETISNLDMGIRDQALLILAETGERKLPFGVEIKSVKSYDYDKSEALAWAKSHNLALGLDNAAFKKIMKADPSAMSFVMLSEKDTVYMPKIIKEDLK